ncbi:MAG: bifunctional adenosylcobinamide kinase/adenosylcobinamide-phosphate guanylyltransferase [Pseudomonadota bacterium]
MGKTIFITGGARSGKSAVAEARVTALGSPAVYIATAEAGDDEMAARIARHQSRRGTEWKTVEEPMALTRALDDTDGDGPRLVDCLTLWLSNLLLAGADWEAAGKELVAALAIQESPVVLVSNEVGAGIVPENALARAYRDAAGLLNQQVAAVADEAILVVAGLPVQLK